MKNVLTMAALVAAVAVYAPTGQAANVTFSGVTSSNSTLGNFQSGNAFTISIDYTPVTSGTVASVTGSTLTISTNSGDKTFLGGTGSMTLGAGNPTPLNINISYDNSSAAVGQPYNGNLTLTVTPVSGVFTIASQANIESIIRPLSAYGGDIKGVVFAPGTFSSPKDAVSFSGSIAVPEPGSIGLLTGLGCVVGRRLWRRRQQKQASAV